MISVAMATYNGEKYIKEQLESIYGQTKSADEIVITDDSSTDKTVAVIQSFAQMHPDCNLRLVENEKRLGYKGNFKKAISLCQGDIIFLSDQDDIWKENKIEALEEILNNNREISLISSSFEQIDDDGNLTHTNKDFYKKGIRENELLEVPLQDLIFHNISQGCAMAFKKEVRDSYLEYYTEEIPHDWILNVVAAIGKKCYFIKRVLFSYRIHGENTTGVNDDMTLKQKNALNIRVFDAQQAIKVLSLIETIDPGFYHEEAWLKEAKSFSRDHEEFLKQKNLKGIMLQNFNPYYRKLKSIRGRLLDIYFCMKNNKVQGGTK